MGTMDQQSGLDNLFARCFRIHCVDDVSYGHGRGTSAACNNTSTGAGRIDIQTAGHFKCLQKIAEATLVRGFHDQIEGVLHPARLPRPELRSRVV
jgi:predicted small secreted protein